MAVGARRPAPGVRRPAFSRTTTAGCPLLLGRGHPAVFRHARRGPAAGSIAGLSPRRRRRGRGRCRSGLRLRTAPAGTQQGRGQPRHGPEGEDQERPARRRPVEGGDGPEGRGPGARRQPLAEPARDGGQQLRRARDSRERIAEQDHQERPGIVVPSGTWAVTASRSSPATTVLAAEAVRSSVPPGVTTTAPYTSRFFTAARAAAPSRSGGSRRPPRGGRVPAPRR